MKDKLIKAISLPDTQYVDAMYECIESMTIVYHDRKLGNVDTTYIQGGRIGVVDRGGYAGSSFTSMDSAEESAREAARCAKVLSKYAANNELAAITPVKDTVTPDVEIDPRKVSFEEKTRLLENYSKIIHKNANVFTSAIRYSEIITRKVFVSTQGSEITQEILTCLVGGRVYARNGNRTESLGFSLGYSDDYKRLLNREDVIETRTGLAVELLKAEPVSAGAYEVLCDGDLSGIFIHEAFGHVSESDDLINNASLREIMMPGREMGKPVLNIIDNGRVKDAPGTYMYDDEGVASRKTYLVKKGILAGNLHSRLSAGALGAEPTGNFRAMDYRYLPLVRQSNIYIEPGESSFGEMLGSIDDGLYLCGGKGGQTMGDVFTFGAQYGYKIRNGKKGQMVKDINISGNVFETLKNITMVGNDLKIIEWGGCGKSRAGIFDMQMLDKSGVGGPHIVIENVIIGGK